MGYQPEFIIAGRKINNDMTKYVAQQLVNALSKKKIKIENSKVLILGFTFKADCPDIRNTKVIDLVNELKMYGADVDVSDHWADPQEVKKDFDIDLLLSPNKNQYDAIVIAVDHNDYKKWGSKFIRKFAKENHVLYDIKYVLDKKESDIRL